MSRRRRRLGQRRPGDARRSHLDDAVHDPAAPALELDEPTGCTADQTAYRKSILEAVNGATGWSVTGDVLTLTGAKTIVLERG